MKYIRKCSVCGGYTLNEFHCGKRTESAHPPPFKPSDRYGKYRRKERGLE